MARDTCDESTIACKESTHQERRTRSNPVLKKAIGEEEQPIATIEPFRNADAKRIFHECHTNAREPGARRCESGSRFDSITRSRASGDARDRWELGLAS
jgi:hypothetical protein